MNENEKAAYDELKASVESAETVETAVETLLTTLTAKIDALPDNDDTASLKALSTQIQADTKTLTDAVVANTPAAPAP